MNKQQVFNETENRKADRFALIQKLGLEYSAEFVPFSKSRNANEKNKSLNWRVTIKRGRSSLTTDYMQGIGHLPGYSEYRTRRNTSADVYAINRSIESGYVYDINAGVLAKNLEKIPAPALQDVLHSLLMDGEALDYSSFEEWAASIGYDKDSRSAEKIYHACIEIALKLRSMLGDENIRKLRDLYQDY